VIVAHQYGFDNAVAVLGTALGEGHIKLLKRFCDRFVLVLDGDEAGQKRTNEVLELFVARQIDLRVLTLPEGLDPCDFLHQRGAEALQHLLDHEAIDALDHAFRTATRGLDVERDVHGATQTLERLIAIIAKAPRPAGEERFREEKVLQRLSAHFRVAENEVRQRLAALRRKGPSGAASIAPATKPASGQTTGDATTDASVPAKLDPWRRELFELLVAHPKFWTIVRREISQEWLTAGPSRLIYETSCRISGEGGEATFERLMLVLEDSAARSLLVELDEGWREKGPRGEPEQLLRALIRNFQLKEASKQRPAQLVALREGRLDDSQTIALLQSMLEQQRKRQNMTDPTDG
jgi:DNA primase